MNIIYLLPKWRLAINLLIKTFSAAQATIRGWITISRFISSTIWLTRLHFLWEDAKIASSLLGTVCDFLQRRGPVCASCKPSNCILIVKLAVICPLMNLFTWDLILYCSDYIRSFRCSDWIKSWWVVMTPVE